MLDSSNPKKSHAHHSVDPIERNSAFDGQSDSVVLTLQKKINQLELENAKLTGELKRESKDPDSL